MSQELSETQMEMLNSKGWFTAFTESLHRLENTAYYLHRLGIHFSYVGNDHMSTELIGMGSSIDEEVNLLRAAINKHTGDEFEAQNAAIHNTFNALLTHSLIKGDDYDD